MDKVEIIKKLKNVLLKERETLDAAINKEKKVRDRAPTNRSSWSDTTRTQTQELITAYKARVENLEKLITLIPEENDIKKQNKVNMWSLVIINLNNNKIKVIIVPEGCGGKEIEGVKLISGESPLGKKLIGKKTGDNFKLNNQEGVIISID